jgi:hypothetical protein
MYTLKYSNHAKRALRNIDPLVGVRIYRALEIIRVDPQIHVTEMKRFIKE